jgi:hypothetical protein
MFKQQVSAATATGDTTKTLIDTFTVPAGCTKIVGVASVVCSGATLTSAEMVAGLLELESDDAPVTPAMFLTDVAFALTSGGLTLKPTQWPCSIPVQGGNRIKAYITMDMAQTAAFKARVQLTYA